MVLWIQLPEISEEIIKPMTLPKEINHSTPFTSYTDVFKWNLIVRATRSVRHALFLLIKGDQIIRIPLKSHSPDTGLASLETDRQHKDMLGKLVGFSARNCMGYIDVSKEAHVLSHPEGGSGEKFNRSQLLSVDTYYLPNSKAQLLCRKSPLSCNSPDILKSLKYQIWYRKLMVTL